MEFFIPLLGFVFTVLWFSRSHAPEWERVKNVIDEFVLISVKGHIK